MSMVQNTSIAAMPQPVQAVASAQATPAAKVRTGQTDGTRAVQTRSAFLKARAY